MKNSRRHFIIRGLLLFVCLCLFENSFADNKVNYLLVWDKNGGSVSFPLSERPCITFDNKQSKVICVTKKEEVCFSIQNIHKYTLDVHEDDVTGVDKISTEKGVLSKGNDVIQFADFAPRTRVKVYTVNGTLIHSDNINEKGSLSISTKSWSNGVYVINVGNSTFKIIKK